MLAFCQGCGGADYRCSYRDEACSRAGHMLALEKSTKATVKSPNIWCHFVWPNTAAMCRWVRLLSMKNANELTRWARSSVSSIYLVRAIVWLPQKYIDAVRCASVFFSLRRQSLWTTLFGDHIHTAMRYRSFVILRVPQLSSSNTLSSGCICKKMSCAIARVSMSKQNSHVCIRCAWIYSKGEWW